MLMRWLRGGSVGLLALTAVSQQVDAQQASTVTDPATGIRYERRYRTVEQPVVERRTEPQVVTTVRPETVTELEPVQQTYFTPVVRYQWEPRWQNVWNPFVAPTLSYQYRPRTHWEARTETYSRPRTTTRWVTEKRVVNQDRLVTAMRKQQVEEWVAVSPGPGPSVIPGGDGPSSNATRVARQPRVAPRGGGSMPPTVLGGDPYSTRPAGRTIYR
jgi:hypothetical protein